MSYYSLKDIWKDDKGRLKVFLIDTTLAGKVVLGSCWVTIILLQRLLKFVISIIAFVVISVIWVISYIICGICFTSNSKIPRKGFVKGFLLSAQEEWE